MKLAVDARLSKMESLEFDKLLNDNDSFNVWVTLLAKGPTTRLVSDIPIKASNLFWYNERLGEIVRELGPFLEWLQMNELNAMNSALVSEKVLTGIFEDVYRNMDFQNRCTTMSEIMQDVREELLKTTPYPSLEYVEAYCYDYIRAIMKLRVQVCAIIREFRNDIEPCHAKTKSCNIM